MEAVTEITADNNKRESFVGLCVFCKNRLHKSFKPDHGWLNGRRIILDTKHEELPLQIDRFVIRERGIFCFVKEFSLVFTAQGLILVNPSKILAYGEQPGEMVLVGSVKRRMIGYSDKFTFSGQILSVAA